MSNEWGVLGAMCEKWGVVCYLSFVGMSNNGCDG